MSKPEYNSGIRDNRRRGSVANDFLCEKLVPGAKLSFVSAYFTIYAFEKLQKELEAAASLDFLFGEPSFLSSIDPERTDKRAFSLTHDGLDLSNQLKQKAIARDCADFFRRETVEIRSVKHPDFLHGKLYHIEAGGVPDAIVGSSNFTVRGLGLGTQKSNLELNLIVNDRRDLNDLKSWFGEVWKDGQNVADVKTEVLRYLEKLYAENSPRDLYFKTLLHILENDANDFDVNKVRGFTESKIWNMLYSFQADGVRGALSKLEKHNGCIIADSVGLGKTFEALAIIKRYELEGKNVLVLCPKRLSENWTQYNDHSIFNPFKDERFHYTVMSHTDLSRETGTIGKTPISEFDWGKFGLVVIDESHNFRNNARGRKRPDGTHVPSRYERLMNDVIKKGAQTQVLLLSATPVNNNLKDLRNQLYLLSGDDDGAYHETVGVASLKDSLALAQRGFTEWADDPKLRRNPAALYDKLGGALFGLLDALTIARSRHHIERYYADTLDVIGHFPTREKPISIFPDIDTQGLFMPYAKLDAEISEYKLALFKPSQYVKEEYATLYEDKSGVAGFSQKTREKYLICMMKVNFLKRLESSVSSFSITMKRTIDKIEVLEEKINDFKKSNKKNLEFCFDVEVEAGDGNDEENTDIDDINVRDDVASDDKAKTPDNPTVGKGIEYSLRHLKLDDWLKELRDDKRKLHSLWLQAKDVSPERDAKLKELKDALRERIQNAPTDKDERTNRKAIVFTAFADTADYLFANLKKFARKELGIHIAKVTGGTGGTETTLGRADFNEILTHFSPRSKKRPLGMTTEEIDLLIATDCISEGQNLQDCGFLVNYDIHWNPVRLIQRFGRIDRIGSRFNSIQMVNFWPVEDLNQYLNLKNRVESRMALADIAATTGNNILGGSAHELAEDDSNYRDRQLLDLQREVLPPDEGVSLSDFSLEEFRAELLDFLGEEGKRLRELPLGMYAVVAATENIAPGVVFCLRAKTPDPNVKPSHVNPTAPYYLLYVQNSSEVPANVSLGNNAIECSTHNETVDDGKPVVRLGFAQAKVVLSLLRELCVKQTAPDETLCEAFAQATKDGQDMSLVNDLVRCAVQACGETLQAKTLSNLTQRGGTLLDGGAKAQTSDFELVTWFVIA